MATPSTGADLIARKTPQFIVRPLGGRYLAETGTS
jgi:hypothetical protein